MPLEEAVLVAGIQQILSNLLLLMSMVCTYLDDFTIQLAMMLMRICRQTECKHFTIKIGQLPAPPIDPQNCSKIQGTNQDTRCHTFNNSFSLQTMNEPNKLKCLSLQVFEALCNVTLQLLGPICKKIKCSELFPSQQPEAVIKIFLCNLKLQCLSLVSLSSPVQCNTVDFGPICKLYRKCFVNIGPFCLSNSLGLHSQHFIFFVNYKCAE